MSQTGVGPIPLPAAGERATGHFTFAGDAGLAKYEWPYLAISGASRGPLVLVTAGIHAAEYTGIEAAIRLGRSVDPQKLNGILLVIPVLNRPGLYERSVYVNPEDGDNLNRLFPGDRRGSGASGSHTTFSPRSSPGATTRSTSTRATSSRISSRSSSIARPGTPRSTRGSSGWPTRTAHAGR